MRILLRLPNWLGDGVMVSPIFEVLKQQYPQADFILVGTSVTSSLYKKDSRVIAIFNDESKKSRNRFFAIYQLGKRIASLGKIDIAITFANHFYSALLLYFSNASLRIGYEGFGRKLLLNCCVSRQEVAHQVLSYANLLKPLNFDFRLGGLKLPYPIKKTHHSVFRIGVSTGGAFGSSKIWPIEYFSEVISDFLKRGYQVILLGSSSEVCNHQKIILSLLKKFEKIPSNFIDLTNQTTIEELILTIKDLDLFLSNDSGPMHIAAAMNTPLIALFGATHPSYCLPWQTKRAKIINKFLVCSPCQKRICPLKHHACMREILPQEVLEASQEILGV